MTCWAKVTFQFEGTHSYPGAPAEVAFLQLQHRHMFHVTVWIEQFHDNRDIEYIMFKRQLEEIFKEPANGVYCDFGAQSCEMIARSIGDTIQLWCSGRRLKVEVNEDGENGALVEFDA